MKKYIFVLYFVFKVVVQIQNLKHLMTTITNRTFKLLSCLFANKFKENKRNAFFCWQLGNTKWIVYSAAWFTVERTLKIRKYVFSKTPN